MKVDWAPAVVNKTAIDPRPEEMPNNGDGFPEKACRTTRQGCPVEFLHGSSYGLLVPTKITAYSSDPTQL